MWLKMCVTQQLYIKNRILLSPIVDDNKKNQAFIDFRFEIVSSDFYLIQCVERWQVETFVEQSC